MKQTAYMLLSLVFLSVLAGFLYYNTVLVDTQSYVLSVYYMQGKNLNDDDKERVLYSYAFKRPVEIAAAALLEPLVGVRQAYSLLNIVLFIVSTLLTYVFFLKLFASHEKKQFIAYCGAVLYATSLPLILYATRILVDVAGYVTLLLGLLLIEWILKKEEIQWEHHLSVSLLLGFFLLVRDTAVILYPYYFLRVLFHKKRVWKEAHVFLFSFWPFIFTLLPQFIFMWFFDVGFLLAGKGAAITAGKYSLLGWLKFFIVHAAAFHIAYFFAWLGWKNDREGKRREFYLGYGFCALIYLIGIQLVALSSPRFSMVLFPAVLAGAGYGILFCVEKCKDKKYFPEFVSSIAVVFFILFLYAFFSFFLALLYPSNVLIPEDAGGNAVLDAVVGQLKDKWQVFSTSVFFTPFSDDKQAEYYTAWASAENNPLYCENIKSLRLSSQCYKGFIEQGFSCLKLPEHSDGCFLAEAVLLHNELACDLIFPDEKLQLNIECRVSVFIERYTNEGLSDCCHIK